MGFVNTTQKRIQKVMRALHYKEPLSKSKISHRTGLHYFVVEDILSFLKANGEVKEIDGKWLLKSKETK